MPVNTILQRPQLQQRLDVKGLRALHFPVHAHRPGPRRQRSGILGRLVFLHTELIEVVVVGQVVQAGQILARGGQRALHRFQFRSRQRADARLKHLGQPLRAQCAGARGHHPGNRPAQKAPPVQVLVLRRNGRRRNVRRFANQHGFDLAKGNSRSHSIRHDRAPGVTGFDRGMFQLPRQ